MPSRRTPGFPSLAPLVFGFLAATLSLLLSLRTGFPFPSPGGGRDVPSLGPLERRLLARALRSLDLEVDPAPQGKRIRRVHIFNDEVFDPSDPVLPWLNVLHATTRREVVARELLFGPGDPIETPRVEETARNLRALPVFSTVVVVPVLVPAREGGPGPEEVDVLVATRDLWSLRPSLDFGSTGFGHLDYLTLHVTESNLLGREKLVSARFGLDRDTLEVGETFSDRRLLGSRLSFFESLEGFVNRETGALEGHSGSVQVARPLYSLDTGLGHGLLVQHQAGIVRLFQGYSERMWRGGDGAPMLPWEYGQRALDVQLWFTRSLGRDVKHDVTAAVGVSYRTHHPTDAAGETPPAGYVADVVPRDVDSHLLVLRYRTRATRFGRYLDLDRHGVGEDVPLGHDLSLQVGIALPVLGATDRYVTGLVVAGHRLALPRQGLLDLRAAAGMAWADVGNGEFEDADRFGSGSLRLHAPWTGPVRAVLLVAAEVRHRDRSRTQVSVGGDSGLRGYLPGSDFGDSRVLLSAELRSRPWHVGSLSAGPVLFFDAADAFDSVDSIVLRHSVGVGLRLGVPQFRREILRLDFGVPVPLDAAETGPAGFLSLHIGQAF